MHQQYDRELFFVNEPYLEFKFAQKVTDPRVGLSIFGPYGGDLPSHPKNISYGLIGTETGIELALEFIKTIRKPIISKEFYKNPRLWPVFPGFQAAFHSLISNKPTRIFKVDGDQLVTSSLHNDPNKRAYDVSNLYLDGIKQMTNTDDQLHVIICSMPDIVYKNCRPKSYVRDGIGEKVSYKLRKLRAKGQTDLFRSYDPIIYQYSVDCRRQLKARSMIFNVPIQIILESTLNTIEPKNIYESVGKSPLSDRAWNLSTTLFYKSGGKPWRLSTAREGVCYVGIVFRRSDPLHGENTACCAAQMFLDSGDGVVIRGDYGPWYSAETRQFHLSKDATYKLLSQVQTTYSELEGKPLREIFLHYRIWINDDEYEGFKTACPGDVKLTCIKVRQERFEVRLFREGTRPILRGTFLKINDRRGYLWTSGFKPYLKTYDGWETPNQLRLDIQHGEEDLMQVATDILGLTKLNYNSCKYGSANPVTIGFSDAVGEILVSNPAIDEKSPKFKFYIQYMQVCTVL